MTINQLSQTGTNLLQTALAKPYHYRRSGRYYLRLRPQGTAKGFFTLSLRTTDKATAMTISKDILTTLKAYHFDNPEATWNELRERLIDIAESCLTMAHGDSSLVAYEMINDEHHEALREASAKMPLSVNQQRAVGKALEIVVSLVAVLERAAQRAGVGDIEDLIGASVQPYSGTDYGLFLLPKMFTSLSYREGRDGNVWKIQATRNGAHQAWDIEIMTVVDIVANGKVKVKLTADGLQTQTVAFPMITRITLS